MNRICVFAGTMIFGWLGWFSGEAIGLEFLGCFLLSGVGSVLGVYVGWKIAQRYR